MGRREFYAWVDQLWQENQPKDGAEQSWADAEHDPGWQAMRDRREKLRGR